jgi:hypothetical protein
MNSNIFKIPVVVALLIIIMLSLSAIISTRNMDGNITGFAVSLKMT